MRKYYHWWVQFYPDGSVRKSEQFADPQSAGQLEVCPDGSWGGVATAKSEEQAITLLREKKRRHDDHT